MKNSSFSTRLRQVRDFLGKNQREMAELIGVSFGAWQGYEAAKNIPGGAVLEALCAQGFNGHWILTGEGVMLRGGMGNVDVDVVREFGSEEEAISHLLFLLPLSMQIVEIQYPDDLREEGVDYLVTLRGGQMQFIHTPLCLDTLGNSRFVFRVRLATVAFGLSPYFVQATTAEIKQLRGAKKQEDLFSWVRKAKVELLAEGDDVGALMRHKEWIDLVSSPPNLIKEWVDDEIAEQGHDGFLIAHLSSVSDQFCNFLEKRKTAPSKKNVRWVVPPKRKKGEGKK
jgi:transcriptional regulator with XRE-family HTH domain